MLKRNESASHLVNGMPQRIKDPFVGHLGHGWMGVNGVRNVFQDRTHFKGKRPFAHQFADVGAHALNAEDTVVVFSSDDTNERWVRVPHAFDDDSTRRRRQRRRSRCGAQVAFVRFRRCVIRRFITQYLYEGSGSDSLRESLLQHS